MLTSSVIPELGKIDWVRQAYIWLGGKPDVSCLISNKTDVALLQLSIQLKRILNLLSVD